MEFYIIDMLLSPLIIKLLSRFMLDKQRDIKANLISDSEIYLLSLRIFRPILYFILVRSILVIFEPK